MVVRLVYLTSTLWSSQLCICSARDADFLSFSSNLFAKASQLYLRFASHEHGEDDHVIQSRGVPVEERWWVRVLHRSTSCIVPKHPSQSELGDVGRRERYLRRPRHLGRAHSGWLDRSETVSTDRRKRSPVGRPMEILVFDRTRLRLVVLLCTWSYRSRPLLSARRCCTMAKPFLQVDKQRWLTNAHPTSQRLRLSSRARVNVPPQTSVEAQRFLTQQTSSISIFSLVAICSGQSLRLFRKLK